MASTGLGAAGIRMPVGNPDLANRE